MKIDQTTINKYLEGINNPNTRKTYKFLLNKFHNFLQNNNINDINQENINTIIHDYKAHLNTQNYKVTTINRMFSESLKKEGERGIYLFCEVNSFLSFISTIMIKISFVSSIFRISKINIIISSYNF